MGRELTDRQSNRRRNKALAQARHAGLLDANDQPTPLGLEVTAGLQAGGYLDAAGDLTPAGELYLHQLATRQWMAEHARNKET